MSIPTRYEIIHPPVQNATSGAGQSSQRTSQLMFQHMMGQQSLSHRSGSPWPQMPQVPPVEMPWSIPSLQQAQLVRFTGERLQAAYGKPLHVKRKMQVPDVAETHRSTKQFITEERMAAHFRDMSISGEGTTMAATTPSAARTREPRACCSKTVDDNIGIDFDAEQEHGGIEYGKSLHPRLVISEELKKLQQEPMLPSSLLSKLEGRPSMALVLWQPPSKYLRILADHGNNRDISNSVNDDNNNTGKNNNTESRSNNNNNNNNNVDDHVDEEDDADRQNCAMEGNGSTNNNNHENATDMNQETAIMEGQENNLELEPMDL